MRKASALFVLALAQSICVWGQRCPSSSDLHELPANLPMCEGVNPLGWQLGASVTVHVSNIFTTHQQNAIINISVVLTAKLPENRMALRVSDAPEKRRP